jgi:hypothetical protein
MRKVCLKKAVHLRKTLRYLSVTVKEKSSSFGDNQGVVTNSSLPYLSLSKRHNALAYHRVQEMIAANILGYYWVDGKNNPAFASKNWNYSQIWHLLKPLLFYSGNTQDLLDIKEDNTIMENKISASLQETFYQMLPTYNGNK